MSLAADIRAFDPCGPLPEGVNVLEASAGTGKTYTIAALAARYVAEGTPLEDLLLVTFTRMATGELRERVRARLVGVEQALADPGALHEDEIARLLAAAPPDVVARRREHLSRALADFDAATIATIHGFCQDVLGGLGIAADVEPDFTFVENVDDLVAEVVDDLYVRRFRDAPGRMTRADAGAIAKAAVGNPAAAIEPSGGDEAGMPAMRRRLALAVRKELERRKRRAGIMTHDDLLTRLAATLRGEGGDGVAERLRQRYPVVLVDEFQDTDPVQWEIVMRAFGAGTLVLIGDPKQAIYAFRGADVYAYLEAAASAANRATLAVNWRSDQGLLDAYDTLFDGAKLGHEGIVYRRVSAADPRGASRLAGAPRPEPLRLRVVRRDEPSIVLTPNGYAQLDSARDHVAKDVAADIVRLLSSGATVAREPVQPGHIAVLVRKHSHAAMVHDELDAASVPAVISGAGSVFGTGPARAWLQLLEALERPTSITRARAAALTPFLGWSAERVACSDEAAWEHVHGRLHHWARVLRDRGVAALAEAVALVEGLPARVLAGTEGERELTDLRHVAQLLHAAASREQLGTAALTSWLRRRIAEADEDTGDEERTRRLESDAAAVQVLTIHRSKGLEFPIVYLPYLWEPSFIAKREPVAFHDSDAGDRRTIDVGLEGADFERHKRRHIAEQRGEDLRLAYVALTRARHQAVVWWAGSKDSRSSALARLLFARDADGNIAPDGPGVPSDAAVEARFAELADRVPGRISVERAALGTPLSWSGPLPAPAALGASRFDRELDRGWRRTSYSDITAGTHEPRVGSEPEEDVVDDEPASEPVPVPAEDGDSALRETPSLLAEMPAGVQIGTFVHRVLEATDFATPDLDAELGQRIEEAQARRPIDIGDAAAVVAGLRAAIETPLGPSFGGLRLRDVGRADRLDELVFELPLAGGDRPSGEVALDIVAAVLEASLPPSDPLAGYAARLRDPALRRALRGYLTGSIDLVVRRDGRFWVVDYKTNRLAGFDEQLTAWHHRPAALTEEMHRAHYALQALLYTVALHRYLRWRVEGYDADEQLGGVLYLFLRGMIGAATPVVDGRPCGVFAWRPEAGLVAALSDALDHGGGS